ncbi:MAG: DUF655 domain-containing protein [Candidatus Nanoarchaeia archaeon]
MAPRVHEDNGIVLDFLQHGHMSDLSRRPVAQVIGIEHLSLLEVAPRRGIFLKPLDRVYIGIDKRDQIHHITRKIEYNDLTETAKMTLESIIKEAIMNQLDRIMTLFNTAGPVSTRQHQLELIPGIGKKHMWAIIEEREKKPFVSIEDLKERVPLIPSPLKSVIKRAMDELEGIDKYQIVLPRLDLSKTKTQEQEL